MLRSKQIQLIREFFKDLCLDGVSDLDIEFLYNYIIKVQAIKKLYCYESNSVGCF